MDIANINTAVVSDEGLVMSYFGVDGEDQRETQRRLAGAVEALLEDVIEGIRTIHVTNFVSTITFTNKHFRLQFSNRCHGGARLLHRRFKNKLLEVLQGLPTSIQYVPDLSAGFLNIDRDRDGVSWTWYGEGIKATGKDCLYDIDTTDHQRHVPVMAGQPDLGRLVDCACHEGQFRIRYSTGIRLIYRSEAQTISLSDMLDAKIPLPKIVRGGAFYLTIN